MLNIAFILHRTSPCGRAPVWRHALYYCVLLPAPGHQISFLLPAAHADADADADGAFSHCIAVTKQAGLLDATDALLQRLLLTTHQKLTLGCCYAADLSGGTLDIESCQLFCRLVTQTPPLSPNRFSALVQDFGNLAIGEGTSDVLLAYEL